MGRFWGKVRLGEPFFIAENPKKRGKNMKKALYILLIIILICGCSKKSQNETEQPTQTISREEFLLDYANKHFVGD